MFVTNSMISEELWKKTYFLYRFLIHAYEKGAKRKQKEELNWKSSS